MKTRTKEQIIELLKPYKFEHSWNVPAGETKTFPYYNNFYVGNGQMDMFVDAVGSQSLPFRIEENLNFVCIDGTDRSAGEPHSRLLDIPPLYYFTNTHAVINTNDNWAKQAETQFHYAHGRGPLAFRMSFLPAFDGRFDWDRVSGQRQTVELYDNVCRTEFLYGNVAKVSVDTFVSWDEGRLAVFRMKIKNLSSENQNVSMNMEPIVVWRGKKRPFIRDGANGQLAIRIDDNEVLFPTVMKAAMDSECGAVCKDEEVAAEICLQPGMEVSAAVYVCILNEDTCEDYEDRASEILRRAAESGYDVLYGRHAARVLDFWKDWYVKFPDKEIDRTYHRNALIIADNLRGGKYYPGVGTIAGSSYAGVGWGMDNVVLYDFLMQINKAGYMEKVLRYFKSRIPKWGFAEGIQFDYAFDQDPISANVVANTSPNYAWLMYAYYRYTGDEDFLKEVAYPVMRAVCNFTAGFAKEKNGIYGIWNDTVYQGRKWRVHTYDEFVHRVSNYCYADTDNNIDYLGPIRSVLKEAISLSERFSANEDERERWRICLERLPVPQNEEHYLTFESDVFHDEFPKREVMSAATSSLVFPMEMPELDRKKLEKTFRTLFELEKYGGTFFASHNYNLLMWPAVACTRMISFMHWIIAGSPVCYKNAIINNAHDGMMLNETQSGGAGYFMMSYGNINTAITRMLLASSDGTIRVFPTLGDDWDEREAQFEGLSAFGGFTVSSRMRDGTVKEIEIRSGCGGVCKVERPRFWKDAVITCNGGQVGFTKTEEVVRIDEKDTAVTVMRFETAPGAEYLITPVQ